MVPSLKVSVIANDNNPTYVGLSLDSSIYLDCLEFITDRFGHLSYFP
jgi:hypothetical protein